MLMMTGESANLHSSVITAQYIVVAIDFAITYMVALPLAAWLGNSVIGIIILLPLRADSVFCQNR